VSISTILDLRTQSAEGNRGYRESDDALSLTKERVSRPGKNLHEPLMGHSPGAKARSEQGRGIVAEIDLQPHAVMAGRGADDLQAQATAEGSGYTVVRFRRASPLLGEALGSELDCRL